MSATFEIPAATGRSAGISPEIAREPSPIGSDVRRVKASDLPTLRATINAEAVEWDGCLRRLEAGAAWLLEHDKLHPRWGEAVALAADLNVRLFRARLSGGHALLAYAGACRRLDEVALAVERERWGGADPTDARALWAATFPDPRRTAAVAEGGSPWLWWPRELGELPEPAELGARRQAAEARPGGGT